MTVRLRRMTRADVPAVMTLEEELFAPDTWSAATYRDELSRTDTRHYLVAVDSAVDPAVDPTGDAAGDAAGDDDTGGDPGVVIGYAGLIAYRDEAHVATIGVTAARQGEGIGALLLDALLAEADRRSPVVLLEVRADNEHAQGLYRRRGFTEIGRRRGYYQPSGTDAIVMRREGPRG